MRGRYGQQQNGNYGECFSHCLHLFHEQLGVLELGHPHLLTGFDVTVFGGGVENVAVRYENNIFLLT